MSVTKEFTVFFVYCFPTHWPPTIAQTIFRNDDLIISVDPSGFIFINLENEQYKFQRLRIAGATSAIFVVRRNEDSLVELLIGGKKIMLVNDTDEIFAIEQNSPQYKKLPEIYEKLPSLDLDKISDPHEWFFVWTLLDLHESVEFHHRYQTIRASLFLRQLFNDSITLIEHVNRSYRQKLSFSIIERKPKPPISDYEFHSAPLFPMVESVKTQAVSVEQFSAIQCITLKDGQSLTVKEIIKAVANSFGGAHYLPLEKEHALAQMINSSMGSKEHGMILDIIKDISYVALEGLSLLLVDILKKNSALV
jgi:hypothetical protein